MYQPMKFSRPQYGLEQQIVEAIYALRQKKSSEMFRQPVDTANYVDYLDRIKKPMDLTKILTNLKLGVYKNSNEIYEDLLLIITNCKKYNRAEFIIKKAEQFMECIQTVWGNFRKQIQKKRISYDQNIQINEQTLKRIAIIQEKRTKKKIPALQAVIEQDKKNILPEQSIMPPLEFQLEKGDKQQLCVFEFKPQRYNLNAMERQQKRQMVKFEMNTSKISQQFEKVSERKLAKYKKIIKKKLFWFDQKIVQKCLNQRTFEKMQVPKHLNAFIQNGKIAQELNIRKLQMYVKKITYWIEDNSNILSDYMKDRFVEHCRVLKKCILRVLKYKKNKAKAQQLNLEIKVLKTQNMDDHNFEERDEENNENNYENKMKQFKRMLDKDRQKSTKRDTKIILRNENGVLLIHDWTSEKKVDRTNNRKQPSNRIDQGDIDERKKHEQRKKQEMKKDEQFLRDYGHKSNKLLIQKYGDRLSIDWELVKNNRNYEQLKQSQENLTEFTFTSDFVL